jgi:hypothetical protein
MWELSPGILKNSAVPVLSNARQFPDSSVLSRQTPVPGGLESTRILQSCTAVARAVMERHPIRKTTIMMQIQEI